MQATLKKQLINYWTSEWNIDEAYDTKFFCDLLGASTFGIRAALRKMNQEGYINIVHLDKNIYYVRHDWYNVFSHFNLMGRVIE